MEIQPRDIQVLERIGELGIADTILLREEFFPNDKTGRSAQNRLKMLADAGLIRSKKLIATDGFKASGSLPTLHFLLEMGADLIERETGVLPYRVTRSDPKQLTLRHRMEIVRARVAIDNAAALSNLPTVDWIMEQDVSGRESGEKGRLPNAAQILNDKFFDESIKRNVAFRPDASFHLQVPRPSGNGFKSLLGYVELDRSTEGHLQWERKMLGINAFMSDTNAWTKHWPEITDPIVMLFAICLSSERLTNLAVTTRPSPCSKRVRFATYPLNPVEVLTDEVWHDCNGQLYPIIRSPVS